jgi:hypothetical protein
VPTPKPTPSGGVSHSRASTERSLRSLNSDGKRDDAGIPRSSPSDFHTEDDGSHNAHSRRASQGLLHSSRGSVSPFEGIAGEQYIDPDSARRGENREGSGGGFETSHNEVDRDDELLPRSSAKSSRRRKRSNRPLQRRGTVHHELLLGGRARRGHRDKERYPSHSHCIGPRWTTGLCLVPHEPSLQERRQEMKPISTIDPASTCLII